MISEFFHLHTYFLNLLPGMKTLNNKYSTTVKPAFDVFSNRCQNNDISLTASCSKFSGVSASSFLPWKLKPSAYLFTGTILHKIYTLPDYGYCQPVWEVSACHKVIMKYGFSWRKFFPGPTTLMLAYNYKNEGWFSTFKLVLAHMAFVTI